LHIFFGLAQFCKKPCNPVFNVLQFFKANFRTFRCNSKMLGIAGTEIEPTTSLAGYIVLTTGIPSGRKENYIFIHFIPHRNSKRK
jgi:hypothetical protein